MLNKLFSKLFLYMQKKPVWFGLSSTGLSLGFSFMDFLEGTAEVFKSLGVIAGGILSILSLYTYLKKHYNFSINLNFFKRVNSLKKVVMKKSWQTTVIGIISGLILIAGQAINIIDGDPETVFIWERVVEGFGLMGLGWFARDKGVSDQDQGLRPELPKEIQDKI